MWAILRQRSRALACILSGLEWIVFSMLDMEDEIAVPEAVREGGEF